MSHRARHVLLAGVATLALAAGCKKDKESLIIASITTPTTVGGLTTVTLTAGVTSQSYDVSVLSRNPPTKLGLYVPESVTGTIAVIAEAHVGDCVSYRGSANNVIISSAGSTVNADIMLTATSTSCTDGGAGAGGGGGSTGKAGDTGTGGAGGTGGATGAAGSTGVGGGAGTGTSCASSIGPRPTVGAPPSLNNCVTYSHNDPGAVCDTTNAVNNPYINSIAFSPDGQLMATGGSSPSDPTSDRIKFWHFNGKAPLQCGPVISLPTAGAPYVAFSPDGQYFAVGWRNSYVYIYSIPTFQFLREIKSTGSEEIYGFGFTPDSQDVVTLSWDGGSDGHLWVDRVDGTAVTSTTLGVDPDALAISPVASNGTVTMAVAGYDGDVGVYTFNGTTFGTPTYLTAATDGAASWGIAFSADGHLLSDATSDGTVQFWNVPVTSTTPTGTTIQITTSSTTINGLSFAPNGSVIALVADMEAQTWGVSSRAQVGDWQTITFTDSVAFSPSGTILVAGGDTCGTVVVCAD